MTINWSWVVGTLLAIELMLQLWLAERQRRALAHHRGTVPTAFASQLTLAQHQKAADYGRERLRFGQCRKLWRTTLIVVLLWGGVLGEWDAMMFDWVPNRVGQPLAFLGLLALAQWVLSLPWQWYGQFSIEARYGFNRTTPGVFWADQAKGLLLGALIGTALLAPIVWAMGRFPLLWAGFAFFLWAGFQFLVSWAYPRFIAPLFNRFTPLQEGELAAGIQRLVEKAGFHSQGVFVMDASKRSGHGNAYFTGLGKNKRIVFFDTLLAQSTAPQTLAVLAHEVGHLKHGHVRKGMVLGLFFAGLGFIFAAWLQTRTDLYLAFGMLPTPGGILLMLGWLLPLVGFPLTPLMAWWSRRHEFEADQYAVAETSAHDLGEALLGLHRDNASSVVHDPLYAGFYFSHPPLAVRLAAMGYKT